MLYCLGNNGKEKRLCVQYWELFEMLFGLPTAECKDAYL